MTQTREEQNEIIARAVLEARNHTAELNAGPMKHTLAKRAAAEKAKSKRK